MKKTSLMMVALSAFSVFAADDGERFALHGRPAPIDFAKRQSVTAEKQRVSKVGVKATMQLMGTAASYPGSVGGNKSYEYISSFTVTPKDGYYKITVKVICPLLYDAQGYPGYGNTEEYVNVWIDWNGDYSWSDSERVMAKSSANYKKILADNKILYFEATVKDASTIGGTFKARAMLGYGYNPINPTTYSWSWGDVMDVGVTFDQAQPEVCGLCIGAFADVSGSSASSGINEGVNPKVNRNNAVIVGRKNLIYPEVRIKKTTAAIIVAKNYVVKGNWKWGSANWNLTGKIDPTEVRTEVKDGEEYGIYRVVSEKGTAFVWEPETGLTDPTLYGEHHIRLQLDCSDPAVPICQLPIDFPFYVFYPAKDEVNGKPMWYLMWKQGVLDDLGNFTFTYLGSTTRGRNDSTCTYLGSSGKSKGEKGKISWTSKLNISGLAWDIQDAILITSNPEYKQSKVQYNIDSVCRTIAHEKMHGSENSRHDTYVMEQAANGELYPRIEGDEGTVQWKNKEEDITKPSRWGWVYVPGDRLIPDHETLKGGEKKYSTDPTVPDTFNLARISSDYSGYGDQEFYVRRHTDTVRASETQRKRDWSFPGAQLTQAMVNGKSAKAQAVSTAMLSVTSAETVRRWSGILTQDNASFVMGREGYAMSVAAPDVSFVSFADKTDDFENQGLVIEVGLQQQNMHGDYIFEAYLFGTNGWPVAYAATEGSLDANSTNITFLFSSDTLAATQEFYEGPYVLGRIGCIAPQNSMANVYSAKNVLTTKDYSAYGCKVSKPIVGNTMSDYADGNGLHVVIPVTVPSAGTYTISAHLATTNGMDLVSVTTNCVCVEGKNGIDICFPSDDVFNTKAAGRFLVRDVSVAAEGAEPSLFVCTYETNPYNYSAFDSGEKAIVIQPNTILLSVSEDADDPNALYKGVSVRFAVDNRSNSDYALYRVSAVLADANGYNVAYAEEDLILNGYSTQTLFFKAQDIRDSGKDGPYSVKYLRITDRMTGELIDGCAVSSARTISATATAFKGQVTMAEDGMAVSPMVLKPGQYRGLLLSVPINSPSVGYVRLAAYVDGGDGAPVGRFEAESEVVVGDNLVSLVIPGGALRESGLDGPYKVRAVTATHSAAPEYECKAGRELFTKAYGHKQFTTVLSARFTEQVVTVDEGDHATVRVSGGNAFEATSVNVYLSWNTAAAADVTLGKMKFPLVLKWAAGEIGEKSVTIPIKADALVEGIEFFTLQLAAANGMDLGEERVCTVRIRDAQWASGQPIPAPSGTTAVTDATGTIVGYFTQKDKKGNVMAKAMPGYVFVGWMAANGKVYSTKATITDKLRRLKQVSPKFAVARYVRALADPANGGKVTGSGKYAHGKAVTLKATPTKYWSFEGWYGESEPAMVNGEQAGETRTLLSRKAMITVTATNDVTYFAAFKPYPKVSVAVNNKAGGTVNGTGVYLAGKTAPLKATPKKGYAFCGWYDEGGNLVSLAAVYKYKMTADGVSFTAMFKKESELAKPMLTWGDYVVGGDAEGTTSTSLTAGVVYSAKLTVAGESVVSIAKVAGLPKGLTYKSGKVSGVPTKAGKYTVSVTVALASNKKKVWTYKVPLDVAALSAFARGTFNGWSYYYDDSVEGGTVDVRKMAVTVSTAGKISVTVGSLKFTGTGWTVADDERGSYRANLRAVRTVGTGKKAKKYTDVLTLALDPDGAWTVDQLSGRVATFNGNISLANALGALESGEATPVPTNDDTFVSARRNPFGDNADAQAIAATLAAQGTQDFTDDAGQVWKLKMAANGVATISRTTGSGKNRKTVSATAVLEVHDDGVGRHWGTTRFLVSGKIIRVEWDW